MENEEQGAGEKRYFFKLKTKVSGICTERIKMPLSSPMKEDLEGKTLCLVSPVRSDSGALKWLCFAGN